MSSHGSPKAIYFDRSQGLVIPEGTPEVIARLARELYSGVIERQTDVSAAGGDEGEESAQESEEGSLMLIPLTAIGTGKQVSWEEIAQMNFGRMVDEAVHALLHAEPDTWSRLPRQYGLYQLNRALTADLSAEEVMEAVAWAGCCLGLVAFANGLTQAPGEVARQRWSALNQIRDEMRLRYQEERNDFSSKAEFIRRYKDDVLSRARAFRYAVTESSVESRMRKWLAGL